MFIRLCVGRHLSLKSGHLSRPPQKGISPGDPSIPIRYPDFDSVGKFSYSKAKTSKLRLTKWFLPLQTSKFQVRKGFFQPKLRRFGGEKGSCKAKLRIPGDGGRFPRPRNHSFTRRIPSSLVSIDFAAAEIHCGPDHSPKTAACRESHLSSGACSIGKTT